jgi:cytochrome P450
VRRAAKDWQTFSSDAPFRVPIPSEESVRSVRQLPLETDPPQHTDYRRIAEPFFQRPKDPRFIARIEGIAGELLRDALTRDTVEVVGDFALPLQSLALTLLLNVPRAHADRWMRWGVHVFRKQEGLEKSPGLDEYIAEQFERARREPGDDFFSALVQARFQGRPLREEELFGYANIAFAGGRDTVIHTISCALAHLAAHPEALAFLREDPRRVVHAGEEFFRVFMPLTHIGRVCPEPTTVEGVSVPAGGRVGLCWASANMDETVFDAPETIRLDRKPNPHLAFGFGEHLCLGAPHARLILRTLLRLCAEHCESRCSDAPTQTGAASGVPGGRRST